MWGACAAGGEERKQALAGGSKLASWVADNKSKAAEHGQSCTECQACQKSSVPAGMYKPWCPRYVLAPPGFWCGCCL